ncbi:DUF4992 family lipoprotein [Dysgonomonas sp. 511]|uniref:DUF4992 family lipoprotein n=1 Tax=Dysgonomonas sp. 511 TaxID=2302930 RepID=UPI0013D55E2F|nr:DUF4992 family lipoprotein [Dysgonomonas sp. 511]NDV79704.1 DUF4957 domain-containing protein [Dysgonomonas sp. 511]
MKKKRKLSAIVSILCFAMVLFVTSCTNGFKDDETFSPGVTNTQLESPDPSGFTITTVTNNETGADEFKIEWPVVQGAGGYLFSLYIVDDEDNPVLVGEEEEFVDGCSIRRPKLEDTYYKAVVKSIGNSEYNNTGADKPTEYAYNSFLLKVATIPSGADLAEWFAANPIEKSEEEQAYELEPGGNYTLNGILDFGKHWITLRGPIEDTNRPTITFGAEGEFITMSGLKLRFLNMDCSAATKKAVLSLSTTPDPSLAIYDTKRHIISETISFQSCNIKGVQKSLFDMSSQDYVLKTFLVSNCIIQLNNSGSITTFINCHGGPNNVGCFKDFKVMNSTFYNMVANTKSYFLRFANGSNAQPQKLGFPDKAASIFIANNTFYQVFTGKDFANNMASHSGISTTIKNNIFFDCFRMSKIVGGSNVKDIPRDTNFVYAVVGSLDSNDKNTYGTELDPSFVGPVDKAPDAVNFRPANSTILTAGSGDPRWLP